MGAPVGVYRTLAIRPGDEPPRELVCPWCGARATTWRGKAALHPETALRCARCGRLVSVSPWVSLSVVPFIFLGIVTTFSVVCNVHEPHEFEALGVWIVVSLPAWWAFAAVVKHAPLVRRP
jgi:hypothetical protein